MTLTEAIHVEGRPFREGELATESTIKHGMGAVEFMIFCEANPLPIRCECGCGLVPDHNARVREAA